MPGRFEIAKGEVGEHPRRRPKDPSIRATVAKLRKTGHSLPSLECALGLKQGTTKKMLVKERKKQRVPADFRALFRMIHKFPELVEVASCNYEPEKSQNIGLYILLKNMPRKALPAFRDEILNKVRRGIWCTDSRPSNGTV